MASVARVRRRSQGLHPVSGEHRPGRDAAAVRDRRRGRRAAGQLPGAVAVPDRRSPVRRGRTAARRQAAAGRAHRAQRRDAVAMNVPPKEDPAKLELRAKPAPVTRLNRRTLTMLVGGLAVAIALVTWWAFRPPKAREGAGQDAPNVEQRSEEHTSELQSLMRISYAVFCLKKKKKNAERRVQQQTNHDPPDNLAD